MREEEKQDVLRVVAEHLGALMEARLGDRFNFVMVRCPAHDDKIPSLRITRGVDGYAALKCFAGCADEDVRLLIGARARRTA